MSIVLGYDTNRASPSPIILRLRLWPAAFNKRLHKLIYDLGQTCQIMLKLINIGCKMYLLFIKKAGL